VCKELIEGYSYAFMQEISVIYQLFEEINKRQADLDTPGQNMLMSLMQVFQCLLIAQMSLCKMPGWFVVIVISTKTTLLHFTQ